MPDWTYHPFFKPLLFRLPPEDARALTLWLLAIQARTKLGRRVFRLFGHGPPPPEIAVQAFGLTFPSPVGLAPGIDIDGTAIAVVQHLGFGFATVGPVGDAAMPRRRETDPLRIASAHAIVRSEAAGGPDIATLAARVAAAAPELTIPIGIALRGDLLRALRAAGDRASYHVLPPSAANAEALAELRAATKRPLLLRLHPDWDDARIDAVVDLAGAAGIDGFVATGGAACPLLPEGTVTACTGTPSAAYACRNFSK